MTKERSSRAALDADEIAALEAIGWQRDESPCPDSSLLLAAEDGALGEPTAAEVRAHVADCSTCQLLSRDLAEVLAEAPSALERRRIDSRVAAGATRPRRAQPWWLAAAGLALAASLVWMLLPSPPTLAPVPDVELARAEPPPAPSVFVVDRPAIPPGEVELTVRGDADTAMSLEAQIEAALDRADKGDVPAALESLDAIVRRHPTSPAAALALGAVLLRADRSAEAAATLDRARPLRTDSGVDDEVDWFLSIALIRTGDRDRARLLLSDICQRGGARGPRACAGIAELGRPPGAR